MLVIAWITLQWAQDAEGNHPIVPAALAPGDVYVDQTGQSPDQIVPAPNAATWEFRGQATTLDALEAAGVVVLWSEEVEGGA